MAGTGSWLLHGKDIGFPLEIDHSVSADISTDRVNGAKTQGTVDAVDYTEFKVKLFKEFSSREEEKTFREQMIQFQNGYEFMPYLLETNQDALEFHEHLVNIKEVTLPREGGKLLWFTYEISFVDLGHKDEFIGYIQYRADPVPTSWSIIEANRRVNIVYPVGAMFHSDTPVDRSSTSMGYMDMRTSPASHTLYYQGGVGKERVDGIIATQDGVQFFSPHGRIGAGFSLHNGRLKMTWDESGHVTYERWSPKQKKWDVYQKRVPYFRFGGLDDKGNSLGVVNSRDALFTKLQLKRFTTEYIEVEQEFQFSNSMVTAVMWHLRRGQIDLQVRARALNCTLDYWEMYNFINYNYLFGMMAYWNGKSTVLSSTTNINEPLTVPSFYAEIHPDIDNNYSVGITNPNRDKTATATLIANQSEGYFQFSTRYSVDMPPRQWSPPIMFYQGTTSPIAKERQSGFLVDANGQVVHRSRVY